MMDSSSRHAFVALGFLASLGCGACLGGAQSDRRPSDTATAVLADQFETVLGINPALAKATVTGTVQPERLLQVPFVFLQHAADGLEKGAWEKLRQAAAALLLGAKDFRPPDTPTGLGDMRSKQCFVVVLRPRHDVDIGKLMSGNATRPSSENDPWTWTVVREGEGTRAVENVFALLVGNSYLIVGNSRSETMAVATELRTGRVATPPIPDWQALSTNDFWAHRTVRPAGRTVAGAPSIFGPETTAISFFVRLSSRTAVLRLLSSTSRGAERLGRDSILPPFVATDAGVLESTFPFTGSEQLLERMFTVFGILGFGIYL